MKLRISALATAALVAVTIPTLSGKAEARGFGIHGDFGHVGGWGGHHGGWGWGGVGLGLATGALVGAALAAPLATVILMPTTTTTMATLWLTTTATLRPLIPLDTSVRIGAATGDTLFATTTLITSGTEAMAEGSLMVGTATRRFAHTAR
jgi:hypothetical protein